MRTPSIAPTRHPFDDARPLGGTPKRAIDAPVPNPLLRALAQRQVSQLPFHPSDRLLVLIHERMALAPGQTWPAFAAANPDLLEWRDGAFFRYYGEEVLESDLARDVFVLPGPFA